MKISSHISSLKGKIIFIFHIFMELLKICSEKLHLDSKIDEFLLMHFSVLSRNVLLWVFLLTNCSSEPMWWKVTFPDWLSFLVSAGEKTRKTQLNDTFLLFGSKQMEGFYLGYNINRAWDWWKWINRHTIWTSPFCLD